LILHLTGEDRFFETCDQKKRVPIQCQGTAQYAEELFIVCSLSLELEFYCSYLDLNFG